MNFKKVCSAVLAALIAASSSLYTLAANTVPSGTTPTGWTAWLGGNAKADRGMYDLVNDKAYSGDASLRINNVGVPSNEQYYLSPTIKSGMTAGKYKLSLKINALPYRKLGAIFLLRDSNKSTIKQLDLMWSYDSKLGVTATPLDDGWYELSWICDASEVTPESLWINIYASSDTYYIDDISLTPADGGENYIKNGGFEVYPRENSIAPSTIPYGYNMWYGGNASAVKNRNPYETVDNISYDGGKSLKFNNIGVLSNEQYYLAPTFTAGSQTGQYKVSLKINALPYRALGAIFMLRDSNKKLIKQLDLMWSYDSKLGVTATPLDDGWYELSWICDAADAVPESLWINFYSSTNTFYIDDLSVTLAGDSENLVYNGGFDEIDPTVPKDLTGVTAENGNASVTISWDTPIYGYGAKIYDITDGKHDLLAKAVFPDRSVKVSGLENGKTYTLSVNSYSNYNLESPGVTVTAAPYLPDFELSGISSSLGGKEYASGDTTFSAELTNCSLDELRAVMLAAIYKNDGTLISTSIGEGKTLANGESGTLSASLAIPDDFADTYVKVYTLDSVNSLKPLAEAEKFNPASEYINKRILSRSELIPLLSNKSTVTEDSDGYIDIERFTAEQKAYLQSVNYSGPSEVRLAEISFTTDSSVIEFDYHMSTPCTGYVSTYIDGSLADEKTAASFDEYGTYTYSLDGKPHRVTIYLPQRGMTIKNFRAASAASLEPLSGRTRAMFFGDSITQGIGIDRAAECYVNQFARLMDYEVLNYGVSGYVFDPNQIKESSYFEPDVIYVAYGTNDAGRTAFTAESYESSVRQFITNLRTLYPTTPIYMITPLWTNWSDRIANLDAARDGIAKVSAEFENVSVIDGLELIPAESKFFGDNLHPNALGAAAYAKNLSLWVSGN